MARWLVRLEGDRIDLEEYPHWFPSGDAFVIEENGEFFLAGTAFETLSDAGAVFNEAKQVLDYFTAVISLLWPSLRKPTVYTVFRETDEGKRNIYVYTSGGLKSRSKLRGSAYLGSRSKEPQKTQAQEMLEHVTGNPHLEQVLLLWGDPMRSWPRLYRILEEVEQHLGKHVDTAGFCSRNERERFARTANTAEASGKDARHAFGKFDPPTNPMTLEEATRFVSRMLVSAIQ